MFFFSSLFTTQTFITRIKETIKPKRLLLKGITATLHDRMRECMEAKWYDSVSHLAGAFSFRLHNVPVSPVSQTTEPIAARQGGFTARAVNQHGNGTRGTKLGCEEGPIEKRRLLSRRGSVYALFWRRITENADLCSYYCIISLHSHQVRLTMSSHASLFSAVLKACWRTAK